MFMSRLVKLLTALFVALALGGLSSAVVSPAHAEPAPVSALTGSESDASVDACGSHYSGNEVYYKHCGDTWITIYVDNRKFAYSHLDRYECIPPWGLKWIGFRQPHDTFGGYWKVGC
jgi:hypothetical protein